MERKSCYFLCLCGYLYCFYLLLWVFLMKLFVCAVVLQLSCFFNTYQRILNVDIAYITSIGRASLTIYLFHYFLLQFIPACKMGGIYSLLISLFGSCLIILICCIWHYQVIQRFNILQVLFCGKISLLKSIINK